MDSQANPIEGTGVEETLDVVEGLWLEAVEGSCEIFLLAAHYADLCAGDGLPPSRSGRALPGTERSVQLGGVGTPRVAEFAASAFGARLRMGTVGGKAMIADALDARHRLPDSYARVRAREARVPWVRHLARKTRGLSVEAARFVDAQIAELVDGRVPWSRFCERLEGLVVAADPEAAAERERARREEMFARASRGSDHGAKGFYIRGPAALVIRVDATVAFLAEALKALGDSDDEDHRRVKALAIMANPMQAVELLAAFAAHRARTSPDENDGPDEHDEEPPPDDPDDEPGLELVVPRPFRPAELPGWLARACDPGNGICVDWPRLLPRVHLNLHLAQETLDQSQGGVVRWEGEGPVTVQYVREQLAPDHAFTIAPVLDLAGQEPVDAYEIPRRHRQAVRLRTPADCFPFAANLDPVDLDHTRAYQHASGPGQQPPPGQSRMDNYSPLGRFHHRVKTHGRWQVQQPFAGIYIWRDPYGAYYLVDHTGTRRTSPPPRRRRRTEKPPRTKPLVVAIHYTDTVVELDFDAA